MCARRGTFTRLSKKPPWWPPLGVCVPKWKLTSVTQDRGSQVRAWFPPASFYQHLRARISCPRPRGDLICAQI